MTRDQIKEHILKKFPEYAIVREIDVFSIVEKIERFSPELRAALENYLESGIVPNIEVRGWTIQRMLDEKHCNHIAAFLNIDWLMKDLKRAEQALNKGHDSIS